MDKRKEALSAHRACRFCLAQDGLNNIHDKIQTPKNSVPFGLKVLACIAVEIIPSDKMPPFVCNRCKFFMELFYDFKQLCRKADTAILNFLQTGTSLEPMVWPPGLLKLFRMMAKSKPVKVIKTEVEGGATVEVMSQDVTDSEDDDQNVYNVKIGDGEEDSACVKVITGKEQTKSKAKRSGDSEDDTVSFVPGQEDRATRGPNDGCWACDQCESTYPLQQLLELHKMQRHRERTFVCNTCDAKFFTKYDLATHQVRHTDAMPFECSVCHHRFKRHVELKRHEKSVHPDKPQIQCPNCPATFLSVAEIQAHQQKHGFIPERPFVCKVCQKRFALETALERHMQAIHPKKPDFACAYCPERFSSPRKLTQHLRIHAGERPYPCKYCNKSFVKSHHYTRHVRVKHPKHDPVELEHPCDQCSDTFATQDELIYHSAIHATQNLTCPLCQEKFEDVDAVTSHIKSHANGIEFMCDFCELVFTAQEKLDKHTMEVHEEEINQAHDDDSSMDMDATEDEDDGNIQVKDEGDHIEIKVNKPDGFMIQQLQQDIDMKMDTNSEESETEQTISEMPATVTVTHSVVVKNDPSQTGSAKILEIKPATLTNEQTPPILKKAEEVKRKSAQLEVVQTAGKKEKVKSESTGGASDKSLRLLEKELQELQRTNPRSEVIKTPSRNMESLRRRAQVHTSTPKPRPTEDRRTVTAKTLPILEKKTQERRAVKENKEPKEKEKATNGHAKEEKEESKVETKTKDEKEPKTKEDPPKTKEDPPKTKEDLQKTMENPPKVKEDPQKTKEDPPKTKEDPPKTKGHLQKVLTKEIPLKTKEDLQKTKEDPPKAKEGPQKTKEDLPAKNKKESGVKNGPSATSNTEENVRRSARASKIKDYAKMIRDTGEKDSDDSDDNDEEYVEEKTDGRSKTRRSSVKPSKPLKQSPAPAPLPAEKPPLRKRGRPRKEPQDVPAKVKKTDTEDESQTETEAENSVLEDSKELGNEEKNLEKIQENSELAEETKEQQPTETKKPEFKTSPGPTLKQIPMKALPPGVKPLPLPPHVRPTGGLCEMQIGQKMVKVQKIVMPKSAVEDMAKKGYLEMKGGTMVLKPGIKLDEKGAIVGAEPTKEPPTRKEKPAPTRCEAADD